MLLIAYALADDGAEHCAQLQTSTVQVRGQATGLARQGGVVGDQALGSAVGSGVVVGPTQVLTAQHVVRLFAEPVRVCGSARADAPCWEVTEIRALPAGDLALLEVPSLPRLPVLPTGELPGIGSGLWVAGYNGAGWMCGSSELVGLHQTKEGGRFGLYQGPVTFGSSGGPVVTVDSKGRMTVVGAIQGITGDYGAPFNTMGVEVEALKQAKPVPLAQWRAGQPYLWETELAWEGGRWMRPLEGPEGQPLWDAGLSASGSGAVCVSMQVVGKQADRCRIEDFLLTPKPDMQDCGENPRLLASFPPETCVVLAVTPQSAGWKGSLHYGFR